MVQVFTETTSTLSSEFVSYFASDKLAIALFRIGKDAGVEFSQARNTYTLVGDWINMTKAHNILGDYFQREVEDKIHIIKSSSTINRPVAMSNENRRGRKPGCTVDKSHYKQVPQPLLQYHDNEGLPLTHESYAKSCQNETSAHSVYSNSENTEKGENIFNTSVSIDDIDHDEKDESDNTVKQIKEKINSDVSDEAELAEVKNEFDDTDVNDDNDLEEQYAHSPHRGSPISTEKANTNVIIKVELEDETYYENHSQESNVSSGGENEDDQRVETKLKRTRAHERDSFEKNIDNFTSVKPLKQDRDYKCSQCDYIGKKRENLREHAKRMHRSKFTCETCKKPFGLHKDLLRHTRNVHANPSFHCTVCNKLYKSNRAFKEHMLSHEDNYVKPLFECEICHKTFSTKYVLTAHVKSEHLGIKKSFICPTCGRSFTQKNSYLVHANVHAGIKPYVCDVCGKAFSYEKSLKEHKYMHDEERRFGCDQCPKRFRQKACLFMHMKVHKEAKDYICTSCGKAFTQRQSLVRHERIHTGEKPFECSVCSRSFGDQSILRRHMMTHHKSGNDH